MFVVAKRGSGKIEPQAQPEHSGLERFCQVQMRMYLHTSDRKGDLGEGANPPRLSAPPCSAGSAGYRAARRWGRTHGRESPKPHLEGKPGRKARGSAGTEPLPALRAESLEQKHSRGGGRNSSSKAGVVLGPITLITGASNIKALLKKK